jgi:hypothetical protein
LGLHESGGCQKRQRAESGGEETHEVVFGRE